MSRVLKFRAWDEDRKAMQTSPKWVEFSIDAHGFLAAKNINFKKVYTPLEIMQFTGLTDKNGVDIYEEHELDNQFGVRFEDGAYILYNISTGDRFQRLTQVVIDGYGLEITREYTQLEKD